MVIKTLLIIFLALFLHGSIKDISKKIDSNNEKISKIKSDQSSLNRSIDILASQIEKENNKYEKITRNIELTSNKILLNKLKLKKAKENIDNLKKDSKLLEKKKEKLEQDVIDFVIEKYAMSMAIEQSQKNSFKQIIDKEVYTLVLQNSKQEVLDLNIDYLKVNRQKRLNEDKTKKLQKYIKKQEQTKKRYQQMQQKQQKSINSLKTKHKQYQKKLQIVIQKQTQLKNLLASLNILKKKEIQKEQERIRKEHERLEKEKELALKKKLKQLRERKKAQKETKPKQTKQMKIISKKDLDDDIDIEVRKLGSSAKGIKISKYNGPKTIAPLKSYTITKKFGKYYDKVYKMKLFNESITLKTKIPDAKVFNVLRGQVVYAKQNSVLLENVVIVKHKNNLHTIYSHLDKISPNLKVGRWIKKGYVVGRISDSMTFQATKNSRYIDPIQLIK